MQDDFKKAKFTVVISDLHLCEAEPEPTKFPLWKKYKTREFFFDNIFKQFLKKTKEMAGGEPIELILDGDIFDFDSVMSLPDQPPFKISWLEKSRGLHPQEEKSLFKIEKILSDHTEWALALKEFISEGNKVIFVIGNHDLEIHFSEVQKKILDCICGELKNRDQVRFAEWFYISNTDTLVEHGNQHDPYCLCEDPINPFAESHGRKEVRLPFGSWATRYITNVMGYFNPHVDTNFILSFFQYITFFFRYMIRSQPMILWTWLWGAFYTMLQTIGDQLRPALRDPLSVERRVEEIARKSNATPGMVRQLSELFAPSAARNPILIARELWLDRAAILLGAFYLLFNIYIYINAMVPIPISWFLVPCAMFLPPLIFYSSFVESDVMRFKEPQESILSLSSRITKVQRVIYGHTHVVRHEIIGGVEHLNSGCWSPAFMDVECTKPIDQKTFVWIAPDDDGQRKAYLYRFQEGNITQVFSRAHQ